MDTNTKPNQTKPNSMERLNSDTLGLLFGYLELYERSRLSMGNRWCRDLSRMDRENASHLIGCYWRAMMSRCCEKDDGWLMSSDEDVDKEGPP